MNAQRREVKADPGVKLVAFRQVTHRDAQVIKRSPFDTHAATPSACLSKTERSTLLFGDNGIVSMKNTLRGCMKAGACVRSEERRVGKESVSKCRSRWSPS